MLKYIKDLYRNLTSVPQEAQDNRFLVPDAEFIKKLGKHFHTPDVMKIEDKEFHLVFVYDDTMLNRRRHSLISDYVVKIGNGFTAEPFALWKRNLGHVSFPIALKVHAPLLPIKGELFAIEPAGLIKLDKYRLNRVNFDRKRVRITLPFREVCGTTKIPTKQTVVSDLKLWNISAWMYVGREKQWIDKLDGGYYYSIVRSFSPRSKWIDKYYYFTPQEAPSLEDH